MTFIKTAIDQGDKISNKGKEAKCAECGEDFISRCGSLYCAFCKPIVMERNKKMTAKKSRDKRKEARRKEKIGQGNSVW